MIKSTIAKQTMKTKKQRAVLTAGKKKSKYHKLIPNNQHET